MTEATNIAAKIDELTLEQMLDRASAQSSDLPRSGGEYDTKTGWTKRLGLASAAGGSGYHKFEKLLAQLVADGLAETDVPGQSRVGNSWRGALLVKSAWMEREAARVAAAG